MREFGNGLLVWAAVALVAFPFAYHLTTRGHWRDTAMGWHLMAYNAVMALVVSFAILNFAVHLPDWFRPLTWLMVGAVAWWRLILLFVVQHQETRDD